MIDLHVHTNMSDGQYSPCEVVAMAAGKGMSVLAIADHETVAGLSEGSASAAELGLGFIPAVEISVEGNRELHILGYYIDYTDTSLLELCESLIRSRSQREGRIFGFLRSHGVELTEEQVKHHVTQKSAGRPHFARAMVEAGYAVSVKDAFDRYLGTPEFDAVERTKPSSKDGIEAIISAGGVPVLAHPALLKLDDERLEALVSELKEYGLAGMECYYSTHNEEQVLRFLEVAKKYNLLVTCGSDFHGELVKPGICLGDGSHNLSGHDEQELLEALESNALCGAQGVRY